jgi:hypothetical protein
MTDIEFRAWLHAEVRSGRMTERQRDDLLEQKQLFDQNRSEIEARYQHQVVGYVGGNCQIGAKVQDLFAAAHESYPGRMVYLEPVGCEVS